MIRKIIDDFIFCPKCQKKLIKESHLLVKCSSCDFFIYLNPAPTNALIIENENQEILLVKRKYPPKKGYFDLPGGFVDVNESLEESVSREIKEELNLNLDNFSYLGSYADQYLYHQVTYLTVCTVFYKKIKNNQLKNLQTKDDVDQAVFFKKNQIPWSKIAFLGIKQALKDYFKS